MLISSLISSLVLVNKPIGSFPSGFLILIYFNYSLLFLMLLFILLNLAIVMTLAFILVSFFDFSSALCSSAAFSSSRFFIITPNSTSLLYLAIFNYDLSTKVFFFMRWSSISEILSTKKGRDHENKSRLLGSMNGYSTSLYYFIFILSFSIKITAPLFL